MLLLTSGAVLLLTSGFYFAYEFVTFRRSTISQLTTLGEVIASNSTAALAFRSAEDASQVLAALAADPQIMAGALYDLEGRIFARYAHPLSELVVPNEPGPAGARLDTHGIVFVHPVTLDGNPLGSLYLHSSLAAVSNRLRLYGTIVAVVVVTALGLALVISRRLQHHVSQPILDLESTARAISERKDYSVRAPRRGGAEIGRLTDAFNQMLDQIQRLNQELEERVKTRTTELHAANQELEAFSYSVSHDLRAPLRHMSGFAAMLERHAGESLDAQGRRYVAVIRDSATRMGQLIDDLLQFARLGRSDLQRRPVPLRELVAEVRQGLEPEAAGRQVEWRCGELPVVIGDPSLLRQAFANLLGNALKYTRGCPVAHIEVGVQPGPDGEAVVFVRDDGAGFDMKYVGKLFGVFQRLHQQEQFEGTGVGLATVKRIVQRHGGRVWADAAVGRGATFYLALPATPAAPGHDHGDFNHDHPEDHPSRGGQSPRHRNDADGAQVASSQQ